MKYKVVCTETTERVAVVEAEDEAHAKARYDMGMRTTEQFVVIVSTKTKRNVECLGEWNEDKDYTVIILREGEMFAVLLTEPSLELAKEHFLMSCYADYEFVKIVEGKIEGVNYKELYELG